MSDITINNAIKKSIFLLGAGASFGTRDNRTGCKMSGEMLQSLQEKLIHPELFELSNAESEAFRFLISSLDYQSKWRSLENNTDFRFDPNIEELALVIRRIKNRENFLPYPLTGNWADKLNQLENIHKQNENNENTLFEDIERKLKSVFMPSWLKHSEKSLNYLKPLVDLMSSSELKTAIQCFTLNYDLTIESYLKTHDVKPYRGFVSGTWRGMQLNEIEESFDRLNLNKIHGSLDWVRLKTDGTVKEISKLTEEEVEDTDEMHKPYVIFGHGTKTFSFDPFFSIVSNFREKLFNRTYIFAIGYSFFDPYINNLIIESLNKDPYKKLIIINPSFGPDFEDTGKGDYDELKSKRGENISLIISQYIEQIQRNSFYSELPEFNMDKINGTDRIHFMKIGFDSFLNKYFANDGIELINLISFYEEQRKQDENPF